MWPIRLNDVLSSTLAWQINYNPSDLFDNTEIIGISQDSRHQLQSQFFIAIKGETQDGHQFVRDALANGATRAIVCEDWEGSQQLSPQDQSKLWKVKNTLDFFRNFASWFRARFPFPVIAIGGSNGKTTTKEMLYALLGGSEGKVTKTRGSENGYLGICLSLCQPDHSISFAPRASVLEIGIDEPGAMKQHTLLARPDLALLTVLGPEHLEKLGTWEMAASEELKLFEFCPYHCITIWNTNDPYISNKLDSIHKSESPLCNAFFFSLMGDNESQSCNPNPRNTPFSLHEKSDGSLSVKPLQALPGFKKEVSGDSVFELRQEGLHNGLNLALALMAASFISPDYESLKNHFKGYLPPPMRSNKLLLTNETTLFEDCYNSSPLSVTAALKVLNHPQYFPKKKFVVLADMLELGEESEKWHLSLFDELVSLSKLNLFLYGNEMHSLYQRCFGDSARFQSLSFLPPETDPAEFTKGQLQDVAGGVILVKGSRGMKLERLSNWLKDKYRI